MQDDVETTDLLSDAFTVELTRQANEDAEEVILGSVSFEHDGAVTGASEDGLELHLSGLGPNGTIDGVRLTMTPIACQTLLDYLLQEAPILGLQINFADLFSSDDSFDDEDEDEAEDA
jgi:hypothetical protein